MTHILKIHQGMTCGKVGADVSVLKNSFFDPGMVHMYLVTGTYYPEMKINWTGIVHHFVHQIYEEKLF